MVLDLEPMKVQLKVHQLVEQKEMHLDILLVAVMVHLMDLQLVVDLVQDLVFL